MTDFIDEDLSGVITLFVAYGLDRDTASRIVLRITEAVNDLRNEIVVHKAAKDAMRDVLVRADSLCSLILHRESHGLTDQTKDDLDDLVRRLRRLTDPRQAVTG